MTNIKNELRNIIENNGQFGSESLIKTIQSFLKRNEVSGFYTSTEKFIKDEEKNKLIDFINENNLFYTEEIVEQDFIAEGAEQKVYRFDDKNVIKLNDSIFYETWLDYFNSLLIHNYFFESTNYELLGFKVIEDQLYAVVKQPFIVANQIVDLEKVKKFLEFNQFKNKKNNDYFNEELGLIFEDLHDENVLSKDGIFYFVDTVFYLTENFYK